MGIGTAARLSRREELLEETVGLFRRVGTQTMPSRGRPSKPSALSSVEHATLHFSVRNPGATQSDLARFLGIQRSHVSEMIDVMERSSLIRRIPDPSNRHSNRLRVTERGHEIHERFHGHHAVPIPSTFRCWTDREVETLHALLKRLDERKSGYRRQAGLDSVVSLLEGTNESYGNPSA